MVDNLQNRGPADRARVNVHEQWELDYWCNKWGCTEAELRAAVDHVGVMSVAVEAFLHTQGHKRK
jgi:hypothetical protein